MYTKNVEKAKDVECEKESEDISHSGFMTCTDNESINESETVNTE